MGLPRAAIARDCKQGHGRDLYGLELEEYLGDTKQEHARCTWNVHIK